MAVCLVVDDSRVIRKVARRIVEDLGFVCEEAEDGQIALDFCKKEFPKAIMLDWNMPVMNGLEFLKALRALPGGDAPIVIFCTTENEMTKIQEAIMAGANEYIMKPFDAEIVSGKFSQVGLLD
jgi:two-component system chemotaxis response regulator CheY